MIRVPHSHDSALFVDTSVYGSGRPAKISSVHHVHDDAAYKVRVTDRRGIIMTDWG